MKNSRIIYGNSRFSFFKREFPRIDRELFVNFYFKGYSKRTKKFMKNSLIIHGNSCFSFFLTRISVNCPRIIRKFIF